MLLQHILPRNHLVFSDTMMSQQNKLQTMKICYCKQTSTWKQSHPPDPPDFVSPPQRTLRQISDDITFQEYLQVFVLVYQKLRILLKQDTALLSHVCVLVRHRRDISSFLNNLIV